MSDDTDRLEYALRGLDYPAPRNKLVAMALENGAPRDVLDRLNALPETADFLNAEELRKALGAAVSGDTRSHGWEERRPA